MVACFFGPMILNNRHHVDPVGLTVEFDASIFVNYSVEPMKAKLRLDNVRRDSFERGTSYRVMATVNVSASSHALPLLPVTDPQFARILPRFFNFILSRNFTDHGEKHVLFGDIVMVRHI